MTRCLIYGVGKHQKSYQEATQSAEYLRVGIQVSKEQSLAKVDETAETGAALTEHATGKSLEVTGLKGEANKSLKKAKVIGNPVMMRRKDITT